MSASNHFFAVDWARIGNLPADEEEFWSLDTDVIDSGDPWIAKVSFCDVGASFHDFTGLMDFLDWYIEAREILDPEVEAGFASVFGDLGILYDDNAYSPRPIKKDIQQKWITGAIPPTDVAAIRERIAGLDIDRTKRGFDRATAKIPCDLCPDGQEVVKWIDGVKAGLSAVVEKGHGMLLVVNA